ncbi:hypothetical protein D3C75_1304490 [compost metagenome]
MKKNIIAKVTPETNVRPNSPSRSCGSSFSKLIIAGPSPASAINWKKTKKTMIEAVVPNNSGVNNLANTIIDTKFVA